MSKRQFTAIFVLVVTNLALSLYLLIRINAVGQDAQDAEELASTIDDRVFDVHLKLLGD